MPVSRNYVYGQSQLTIEYGDITTATTDALVSTDDWRLSMSGGVAAAIMRAAGSQLVTDAAKAVPAALGSVVVTSGGMLPARYVFHAITIGETHAEKPPRAVIASATRACLRLLDPLGIDSIAFPAIGAGTAGFPIQDVAVTMAEVIADELEHRERGVTVHLYLFPDGGATEFDYIAFFEEFRARVPAIARHEEAPHTPERLDGAAAPPRIFLSYSHRDREWLERFQLMLSPLLRTEQLATWSDTEIEAGSRWEHEIRAALDASDVAVLLVSPPFLASTFVRDVELPYLLAANRDRGVPITWLYLSECLYDETAVATFEAAHDIALPMDRLSAGEQNSALADACKRIKAAAYAARKTP